MSIVLWFVTFLASEHAITTKILFFFRCTVAEVYPEIENYLARGTESTISEDNYII